MQPAAELAAALYSTSWTVPPWTLSAKETQKRTLFGSNMLSSDQIGRVLCGKLSADAPVHTLEMQARGGVAGSLHGDRLLHLGADHNVPVARSVNVGAGFKDRQLWVAASAQTKAVHSALLVPNGKYESIQAGVKELKDRPGGPPRLFTVDDMPNNHEDYMADLSPEACAQDLKHGLGRIINTLDPSVKDLYSEVCGELSRCFMEYNRLSISNIQNRLTLPAVPPNSGTDHGLWAGGKFSKWKRDGEKLEQVTMKVGEHPVQPGEVDQMMNVEDGGYFFKTFHHNLWKDWVGTSEIAARLNRMADKLDHGLAHVPIDKGGYDPTYGVASDGRCVFTYAATGWNRTIARFGRILCYSVLCRTLRAESPGPRTVWQVGGAAHDSLAGIEGEILPTTTFGSTIRGQGKRLPRSAGAGPDGRYQ
jgi:hypothetical protein